MDLADLPPADLAAAIDRACASDASLRAEVESLLRAHSQAGHFLGAPTAAPAPPNSDESPTLGEPTSPHHASFREGPGTRIGPYKLLQLIGEGGFGSVFMAEQEHPVRRRVALKIIKLGMDTRQVVARFEQERQALAILDHPNIAKVFDAGATDTGRPYFVMELCTGEPIDAYCDRHNLSIPDRLALFSQVCQAVQHAHTKGIIHRDIKPRNVLVATQDGRAHAKVIDFGIAKATESRLTERTLFTEHKQIIGTPEYMSPEQAEGSLDIDTRTDVYALGVLLYELLTGSTPFTSDELRSAAYAEIQRIIREVDPPAPSTRLNQNAQTLASVAARRRVEPRKLGLIIRGELDWIVMKALEKDRSRRYETASGFAMDIQRYLAGEAVVAAPPSTAYRLRKFMRRNKGPVMALSAVAASLLIGVVAFAWQARIAGEQRDIAVAAEKSQAEQRERADAARADAQAHEAESRKHAAIAQAVARFQTDMLAAADPSNLKGDKVTVVQAMEAAIKTLDGGGGGSLKEQPLVEAGVRETIGNTLRGLGRYDAAEPNLRRSLALRREALPAGHPDIAQSLNFLALLLKAQNKLAEAEPLYREALAIRRAALPAGHPDIANSLNNLATLLRTQEKFTEAEPLYREALAIRRAALPAGHPDIATSLNNLATILQGRNKLADAESLYREALAIRRAALPAGHPDIATSLNNLAWLLQVQNKFTEAEPLYREALAIRRAALPSGHPDIATSLNSLALLLKTQNRLDEADPLYRESLDIRRAALPAGHPDIATGLSNLAALLHAQNKDAQAEPLCREALAIDRAARPAGHPDIVRSLNNLASLLQAQNKLAEAESLYRESLEILRSARPNAHSDIATGLNNLARVQHTLGRGAAARAAWDEAITILRTSTPDGSALLARLLWRSGSARLESKTEADAAAALPELEAAAAMAEKFLPADHPHLKEYRQTLAACKAALAAHASPDAKP
jgi:serine/threonine protein kinase